MNFRRPISSLHHPQAVFAFCRDMARVRVQYSPPCVPPSGRWQEPDAHRRPSSRNIRNRARFLAKYRFRAKAQTGRARQAGTFAEVIDKNRPIRIIHAGRRCGRCKRKRIRKAKCGAIFNNCLALRQRFADRAEFVVFGGSAGRRESVLSWRSRWRSNRGS